MKTIEKTLQAAINNDAILVGCEITVSINGNEAILIGRVDQYLKKEIACNIARAFPGVVRVIERLDVHFDPANKVNDQEIRLFVFEILERNLGEAYQNLTVTVQDGVVELKGSLKWNYQKDLAAECIVGVRGLRDIINLIMVAPISEETLLKNRIRRSISVLTSKNVNVEVIGNIVTITGSVPSQLDKDAIARIVEYTSGVNQLQNDLLVADA